MEVPLYRIRRVGDKWVVLRLHPGRSVLYFPVKQLDSWDDAIRWYLIRTYQQETPIGFDSTKDDFPHP